MSPRSSDIVGGKVSEVPFARVFGALALRKLTGVLRLEQDRRSYALYFQDGAITDADSSSSEDTLGRVAIEAGLVESQVVGESVRRMAQNPTRSQKDILLELGALKGPALEQALRLTLTRRTLRIFSLPNANFAVDELAHGRLEGGPVEPRWSLYRGLRLHYDERRLDLEMSAALAGTAFKLTVDPALIYEAFGFSNDERVALAYLQRAAKNGYYWELGDLVDVCMTLPRATVLAVVHALHAFETLELKPASTVPRFKKPRREPTQQLERQTLELRSPSVQVPAVSPQGVRFTPPTGAPINRPTFDPASRDAPTEPNPPVEPLPRGTNPPMPPFTVSTSGTGTGLPPSTSSQSVPITTRPTGPSPMVTPASAPNRPVSRPIAGAAVIGPTGGPPGRGPTPSSPAAKVGSGPQSYVPPKLGTDPGLGGRMGTIPPGGPPGGSPTQVLRDQIAAKQSAIDADADFFALLEIDRSSNAEQVKRAWFSLASIYHPDKLPPKLESLRPQITRIFTRLNDAYATLSDDGKRNEYVKVLARGGEAAVRRKAEEEAAKAMRIVRAETHFKDGEMAMRRQNYQRALEEFQAAVDLNDTEADYHASLAWAKWCNTPEKSSVLAEVKTGLQRAIQLNNRCVDAFYYRGQIFNWHGDTDKAYRAFQSVLSLKEDHVEAAREVRLMEMRGKGGPKGGGKGGGWFRKK